jgi:hypothetical protein
MGLGTVFYKRNTSLLYSFLPNLFGHSGASPSLFNNPKNLNEWIYKGSHHETLGHSLESCLGLSIILFDFKGLTYSADWFS